MIDLGEGAMDANSNCIELDKIEDYIRDSKVVWVYLRE